MTEFPKDPERFYEETMPNAPKPIKHFYAALTQKNREKLLAVLAVDFSFVSPLAAFDNPAGFADMVGGFAGWVESERVVVDGDLVAHQFLYHMTEPGQAIIPMCEVFELENGRVRSSRAYNNVADFPQPAGS